MKLTDSDWNTSCDFCHFREGRHFCLLHGQTIKNMDAVCCGDWEDAAEQENELSELTQLIERESDHPDFHD